MSPMTTAVIFLLHTTETCTIRKLLTTELAKVLLEGGLREAPNRKVTHTEVTERIDVVIYTIHLCTMVIDYICHRHRNQDMEFS